MRIPTKFKIPNFFTRQQSGIGLDIGSSSIKLIGLEAIDNQLALKKLFIHPIDLAADLTASLDYVVKSQEIGRQYVNVSLSGHSTLVRYISFPSMGLDELKGTMQFEAKEYIPLPLEEVILDCAVLKDKLPGNKMLVLLAAAKKEEVQKLIATLGKVGLSAGNIDIDCLCLANAFNSSYPISRNKGGDKDAQPDIVGILNIGNRFTNMIIMESGALRFSRDIAFGGEDITKKISELQQSDCAKAELTKADPLKMQEVMPNLESLIDNLSSEVRRSLDYYVNQSGNEVARIFISGGSAGLPDINKLLNDALGVPIEYLDVFTNVDCSALVNQDLLKFRRNSFAVALGLALRE